MADPATAKIYFAKLIEIKDLALETSELLRDYSLELQGLASPTNNQQTDNLTKEQIIRISNAIGELDNVVTIANILGDKLYNEWK